MCPIIVLAKRCLFKFGSMFEKMVSWVIGITAIVQVWWDFPYSAPMGFFLIGMALDIPKLYTGFFLHKRQVVVSMIGTGVGAVLMAALYIVSEEFDASAFALRGIGCVQILLSIAFMMSAGAIYGEKMYRPFMKNTFWCYCAHVIFTSYICLGLMKLNKSSCLIGWFSSIVSVICGVLAPIILHRLFIQRMPRVMKVLCGGR